MQGAQDLKKIAQEIAEKVIPLGGDYFNLVHCELKERNISHCRGLIFTEVGRIISLRNHEQNIDSAAV